MNAEQMFKELGYKQVRNDSCLIKYEQFINGNCTQITFTLLLKKVIATYGYQTSGSYAHDITSDEFRAIVQQEKELGWLEEEKQEIKQETNFEHYKDDIIGFCLEDLAISKGKVVECCAIPCSECDFDDKNGHCIGNHGIMKWLKQPYIKPVYKLTKFEIDLLQSCSQGYSPKYQFKNINSLTEMRKNGYFKGVNRDATIEEIIAKSEVVG